MFYALDWPCPESVIAVQTLRYPGVSVAPYDGFNLALHVDDDPVQVLANRNSLAEKLGLESDRFVWASQVHGTDCQVLGRGNRAHTLEADAFYSRTAKQPCLVMTADCLPVFFCDNNGSEVAVAHAGWRGLASGVLAQTVAQFDAVPIDLMAYLGPAISSQRFEVGQDVLDSFVAQFSRRGIAIVKIQSCFIAAESPNKFLADIYALARLELETLGMPENAIYGGGHCTYTEDQKYYSYRRDGVTGRMASVIYLKS